MSLNTYEEVDTISVAVAGIDINNVSHFNFDIFETCEIWDILVNMFAKYELLRKMMKMKLTFGEA